MTISSKVLCNKVQSLRPDRCNSITPELLEKTCEEPSVQPFLKWFCENITQRNVLTDEELRVRDKLRKTGEWLEGADLDSALEQTTQNCPELSKLIFFNETSIDNLLAEYEIVRELRMEDDDYVQMLQEGLQNLKTLGNKLDEDIEEEMMLLKKERIEADKAYNDCFNILEQFDTGNREFSKDVEHLLAMYANAANNKETPITWTQMPLELFVKQMELYNGYLGMHIKRQFGINDKEQQEADSDYASLINDSKEKRIDGRELMLCKTNIANDKMKEAVAKVREESYISMLEYVQEIYNNGSVKVPKEAELRTEIVELTGKRDSLEENVNLLRDCQLAEVTQQLAELEITKALKYVAETRLERRRTRFEKLKNLQFLSREQGHVHADLLCMLMEMQFRCLKDVAEFIADARHYLATEYSLSSTRYESMQHLANEHAALFFDTSGSYNSFNKFLCSMIRGGDTPTELYIALEKYNEAIDNNKTQEKKLMNVHLTSKIDELLKLEYEANSHYTVEIQQGPTHNLKAISYEISTSHDEALAGVQKVQADLSKIRTKLKEQMRTETDLERERDILWQRFLADPDTLIATYEAAKKKAEKTHFGDNYKSK